MRFVDEDTLAITTAESGEPTTHLQDIDAGLGSLHPPCPARLTP